MRWSATALLGALALGLAVAGCGSAAPAPLTGRELFSRDCGFCHSLTGHSSPRQQGGDLLDARLGRRVLAQYTAEMPVKRRLRPNELSAVVDYMLAVQARRP